MQERPQNQESFYSNDEIYELRELLSLLVKRKWFLIIPFIISSVVAIPIINSIVPTYTSTATLLIEPESINIASIEDLYSASTSSDEFYETQYEILRSRFLAEKVIVKLELLENKSFMVTEKNTNSFFQRVSSWTRETTETANYIENQEIIRNSAVKKFLEHLSVDGVTDTQLVRISFRHHDRILASQLANTLAKEFIENGLNVQLESSALASDLLNARLKNLREELQISEAELHEFREKQKVIEINGGSSISEEQLSNLSEKLITVRANRESIGTMFEQVNRVKDGVLTEQLTVPFIQKDTLVSTLREEELAASKTLKGLSSRYGPKHPYIIEAKAVAEQAAQNVKSRVLELIQGVEQQHQSALAEEKAIENSIEQSQNQIFRLNRENYKLNLLEREVESTRELYALLLEKQKESDEILGLKQANARITDLAIPAIHPSSPNKTLILIVSSVLGLILGLGIIVSRELFDNGNTIKKKSDIVTKLKVPLIGALPKVKGEGNIQNIHQFSLNHPDSLYAESLRTARTSILLSDIDRTQKLILVTSSFASEGKSTICLNLAASLSKLRKVLLIDADMRKSSNLEFMGLSENSLGLGDFLSHMASMEECVHKAEHSANLFIMPSGINTKNPLELLSSKDLRKPLDELSKSYDHIIIDTGPLLVVSDPLVIAKNVDSVILVVKANATPILEARQTLHILQNNGVTILGAILNAIDESEQFYGYTKNAKTGSYGYIN